MILYRILSILSFLLGKSAAHYGNQLDDDLLLEGNSATSDDVYDYHSYNGYHLNAKDQLQEHYDACPCVLLADCERPKHLKLEPFCPTPATVHCCMHKETVPTLKQQRGNTQQLFKHQMSMPVLKGSTVYSMPSIDHLEPNVQQNVSESEGTAPLVTTSSSFLTGATEGSAQDAHQSIRTWGNATFVTTRTRPIPEQYANPSHQVIQTNTNYPSSSFIYQVHY